MFQNKTEEDYMKYPIAMLAFFISTACVSQQLRADFGDIPLGSRFEVNNGYIPSDTCVRELDC